MIRLLLLCILLIVPYAHAQNDVKILVKLSPTGSFEISGKLRGKVTAKNNGFVAQKLSVKTRKLATQMELRDKHLHEKLEYKKYPKITVINAKAQGGKGKGKIKIKGITKSFSFIYEQKGKHLIANFKLSLKDFGIAGIQYMGVGVEDDVTVVANLSL